MPASEIFRAEAALQARLAASGDLLAPDGASCVWCERRFTEEERLTAYPAGARRFLHARPCRQQFEEWLDAEDDA
jgi:hypothetical protein